MVYFGGFFAKLGHVAGFSSIIEAANIIFIFGCRVAHLLEMERLKREGVWIDLSLFTVYLT